LGNALAVSENNFNLTATQDYKKRNVYWSHNPTYLKDFYLAGKVKTNYPRN
jgi:hypothetical protein